MNIASREDNANTNAFLFSAVTEILIVTFSSNENKARQTKFILMIILDNTIIGESGVNALAHTSI